MFDKLEELEKKYNELTEKISDPEVIADQDSWRKYMKEQSAMKDVVDKYVEYKQVKNNMDEAKEMMSDPEMKEFAEEEYYSSKEKLSKMEEELKPQTIELTDYEKKQEEEAIISYQELLQTNKDRLYNITDEEETVDFIKELKSFRSSL